MRASALKFSPKSTSRIPSCQSSATITRTGMAPGCLDGLSRTSISNRREGPLRRRLFRRAHFGPALPARVFLPPAAFAIIEARSATMYNPAIVEAFREVCTSTQTAGTDDVNEGAEIAATSDTVRTESGRSTLDDIDELQLALALGAALSSTSERGASVASRLFDALGRLPGVDTVAIFVVDEPQHRLVGRDRPSGTHARRLDGLSMAMGDRISGWVAATGQPIIDTEAGLDLLDVSATALRAAIAVPCSTTARGRPRSS